MSINELKTKRRNLRRKIAAQHGNVTDQQIAELDEIQKEIMEAVLWKATVKGAKCLA